MSRPEQNKSTTTTLHRLRFELQSASTQHPDWHTHRFTLFLLALASTYYTASIFKYHCCIWSMLLRSHSRKCCTYMHPHRHITYPHTCHSQICYRVYYTAMHCNALHYILRFTVLLCMVRYWYATHWITLHCNAMASSTMHCTTLCRGSLYYSALWYTVVYYDAMSCAGLQWVVLHYSTLYCSTQQCTVLNDSALKKVSLPLHI